VIQADVRRARYRVDSTVEVDGVIIVDGAIAAAINVAVTGVSEIEVDVDFAVSSMPANGNGT
jgi:hypothetical protein